MVLLVEKIFNFKQKEQQKLHRTIVQTGDPLYMD